VWVDGILHGNRINESLDTRNWEKGLEAARSLELGNAETQEEPEHVSIEEAVAAFMADVEQGRQLSEASLKKYRVLLKNEAPKKNSEKVSPSLTVFCRKNGLRFTAELNLQRLSDFRQCWKDRNISAGKKLERLCAFCGFLVERGWMPVNYAKKLKAPVIKDPPTMPFSRDEVVKLLAGCGQYTDWRGRIDQPNAKRLRALCLLMRYSGLRIGDAASYPKSRLNGSRLFLYTAKTGVPVRTKLPDAVVGALNACPPLSDRYWFWTGNGSKETLTGNWRRAFRRLCELAGIDGGHPHRFRDTFAIELLLAGVPIERVSTLLGHSSVKITERHYAPWVRERQEQLEADLDRTWDRDPILFALGEAAQKEAPPDGGMRRICDTVN
jgi:integrase